jgi:archaeal chaperonin
LPQTSATNVFSPNQEHLKGKDAWRSNLRLTALAAERIRSSLGPNGAYKMITYNRGPEKIVKVTKDAVAVLQELAIQYPTLVVLSEAAKIQREELGDGVKCFVILTAELLKKADQLVAKRIHPSVILKGYQEAAKKALETINANSQKMDPKQLAKLLDSVDCGKGYLTPELRDMLIEAVKIANRDGKLDKAKIRIIRKPGGSQSETKFIKGLIIKKGKLHPNMPNAVQRPRIAVSTERIGTNRLEIKMPGQGPFHMKFDIMTPQDLEGYLDAENQRKIDALKKLREFGVNVLFCQQPIDDFSKAKLFGMGVLAFDSVDRADLTLISKSTGAKMVGNLSELEETNIGIAEKLEIDKIELEKTVNLSGCDFGTFLIRGSNLQALDELELLIGNSLSLLRTAMDSGKTVAGGGATEFQVANALKTFALQFPGREQLAIISFAEALLELPRCLAVNNGLNPDDALLNMGKLCFEGSDFGLGADGAFGEVCVEVSEAKNSAIRRAFEVATLMLRIDEQVRARESQPRFHKQNS